MKLGVLLLFCKDAPRQTTFTRAWAERAVQTVADFVAKQSGGRERIDEFKVFEWKKLDLTVAEWSALGFNAGPTVRPTIIPAAQDPYTHILMAIDVPGAGGGVTTGVYTHLAAGGFNPSLIAHELGHRFGADDAFGEQDNGPQRYQNAFDVMGGGGWPVTMTVPSLADPAAPGMNIAGPNMSAPSLMATGWLNPQQQGVLLDLSNSASIFTSSGVVTELSALNGAPGPAWTRPPLVIRYFDLLVEYRVRAGWDAGLPPAGPEGEGWIVVHRSAPGAPPATLIKQMKISALRGTPGSTMVMGDDNIFLTGPLRVSVLRPNLGADTVKVSLTRRPAVVPGLGGGGAVPDRGVWDPDLGVVPIPSYSPLAEVVTTLAGIQALHQAQLAAASDETDAIEARARQAIDELQRQLSRLPATPTRSPLTVALEHVTELREAGERSSKNGDGAREFLELGRERLADVEQALAEAVAAEQRA